MLLGLCGIRVVALVIEAGVLVEELHQSLLLGKGEAVALGM